jgi:hypothetical protein
MNEMTNNPWFELQIVFSKTSPNFKFNIDRNTIAIQLKHGYTHPFHSIKKFTAGFRFVCARIKTMKSWERFFGTRLKPGMKAKMLIETMHLLNFPVYLGR